MMPPQSLGGKYKVLLRSSLSIRSMITGNNDGEKMMEKKQMSVEEFLNKKENWKYDFREEIVTFHTEDPIDRYHIYKAIGIAEEGGDVTDPVYLAAHAIRECHYPLVPGGEADNSLLVQELFRIVWDEEFLEDCMDGSGNLKIDTLNSAFHPLTVLLKLENTEVSGRWSNRKVLRLYITGKFREIVTQYRAVEEFLKVCYTIGNFMPVPVGSNGPRGCGKTDDYWDLALDCMYNWYLNENIAERKKSLEHLLNGKIAVANQYGVWLDKFGRGQEGWNRFVEVSFMQPFVDEISGKPKKLCEKHVEQLSENKDKFMCFFVNATERILARGELIADAVRSQSLKFRQKEGGFLP